MRFVVIAIAVSLFSPVDYARGDPEPVEGSGQSPAVIKPGTLTAGDIAVAVAAIPRFTPDRFVALPPTVRDAFTQMNCQVPQNSLTGGPANVVQGELAARGQRDWAALCSNGTLTEIRVVWGGPARCDDRVAPLQDSDSVMLTAPGVATYMRSLAVASTEQIARHLIRLGATLPETSHDALEDGPANARLVYYCRGGRWLLVHQETR